VENNASVMASFWLTSEFFPRSSQETVKTYPYEIQQTAEAQFYWPDALPNAQTGNCVKALKTRIFTG